MIIDLYYLQNKLYSSSARNKIELTLYKHYDNCNNYRENPIDQQYQNQLELERLEIIKKELEIKEMKRRYRREHGFRLFGRRN